MIWNHRVIVNFNEGVDSPSFDIHECFYENIEDVIPTSWTENPIPAYSDSLDGLKKTLERMRVACDKLILIERDGKLEEWNNE